MAKVDTRSTNKSVYLSIASHPLHNRLNLRFDTEQPTMGVYAIEKLGTALAPLIGKEVELAKMAEGTGYMEAEKGWTGTDDEEEVNLEEWTKIGKLQMVQVKEEFVEQFKQEYSRIMRLKLGLEKEQEGDFQLFSNLLDLVEKSELDFTNSFRILSQFDSTDSPAFKPFLDTLLRSNSTSSLASSISTNDRSDWTSFFKTYETRIGVEGPQAASTRRSRMNDHNPRFALRQWVLEETIKKVDSEGEAGIEQLNRVLEMSQNPFEAYGESEVGGKQENGDICPTNEEMERKRLCGVGSKDMLGFQCSCSS